MIGDRHPRSGAGHPGRSRLPRRSSASRAQPAGDRGTGRRLAADGVGDRARPLRRGGPRDAAPGRRCAWHRSAVRTALAGSRAGSAARRRSRGDRRDRGRRAPRPRLDRHGGVVVQPVRRARLRRCAGVASRQIRARRGRGEDPRGGPPGPPGHARSQSPDRRRDSPKERGWRPAAIARIVVLPDTSTSRDAVDRHRATFDAALPGRTIAVRRWLRIPANDLRAVWFLRSTSGAGGPARQAVARGAHGRASRSGPAVIPRDTNGAGENPK
jgi:hypothetical protein